MVFKAILADEILKAVLDDVASHKPSYMAPRQPRDKLDFHDTSEKSINLYQNS